MKEKKMDKLNFVTIKSLCSLKDSVKKMKKQTTDWEEVFVNHVSNKRLVFRLLKELFRLNSEKKNKK